MSRLYFLGLRENIIDYLVVDVYRDFGNLEYVIEYINP
jgi:hypothetical protein